ncbi:SH3 domain-containing protein [Leisingera sp. ANG-M7]|uniref:SH3 domain-containing protein n=1 Tax=Leisingera sp. ANG-M7 TaxID=1577902 RepID=UPI00057EEEB6|nr:SH3 domain-containing protein [Leisingera sp. ANG-M7]KIC35999.1 peptide-binding protein [Leisingera sp. ANG-M7]
MRGLRAAAVLCLGFLAMPAAAQEFPALHNVTGVASDDVLNIRSAPSAGSEIIGTLAPDQTGVEVVLADGSGKWGLVNSGEQSGWAALRYLDRISSSNWHEQPEQALECFGTEPFWSLTLDEAASFSTPDSPGTPVTLVAREPAAGRSGKSGFLAASRSGSETPAPEAISLSGTLTAQHCSDGMSDRIYGISIDLLRLRNTGRLDVLTGCCSLLP